MELNSKTSRNPRSMKLRNRRSRGAALIITLILLALLTAASVATVVYVSSDTLINGYYRNYRASFYAADSGANIVIQAMQNAIVNAANQQGNPPLTIGSAAYPTDTNWHTATGSYYPNGFSASYTAFQNSYYSVGDPGSWQGKFKLASITTGAPQFQVQADPTDGSSCFPLATCKNGAPNDNNNIWTFVYPYTITIQGQSTGHEAESITMSGNIIYSNTTGNGAAAGGSSFSKWGAYIGQFSQCQGALVQGTMSGPFFTNGSWNFASSSNPGYTFNGIVEQAVDNSGQEQNVSYWKNGACTPQTYENPPKGFRMPTFQQGFNSTANQIVPPSNTYSQADAVLDGKGAPPCYSAPCPTPAAPTQQQLSQTLQTIGGTAYSSGTNGVYIPWYTSNGKRYYGSNPANGGDGAGGGFFVNGNASVTLTATTAGNGNNTHPTQTYTITQGGTTTTIVVDNTAGTTTVNGVSLQGVPQQLDPVTGQPITQSDPSGSVVNPTMVYVNGQVTGLSGTIQNNTGISVTTGCVQGGCSSTDVSITGDLLYASSPVSIPSDALNSSTNAGVLGVYTQGNINLYPNSSGSNRGNLTVDASLAALSGVTNNPNSGFATPGQSINTWTIVGGRAEDHAHPVSIGTGNTYYDQRFSNNFGPPWFPTAVPQPGDRANQPSSSIRVKVTSWHENR